MNLDNVNHCDFHDKVLVLIQIFVNQVSNTSIMKQYLK